MTRKILMMPTNFLEGRRCMKISTKGRYGLRAIVDIALNGEKDAVSISSISERQSISVSYLEQLLAKLRKAELIKSIRGAQGGYRLNRPAEEISVGAVLRALEGDLRPVDCSELSEEGEGGCESANFCVTKYVWQKMNDSINETVNHISIHELVEEAKMTPAYKSTRDCEK